MVFGVCATKNVHNVIYSILKFFVRLCYKLLAYCTKYIIKFNKYKLSEKGVSDLITRYVILIGRIYTPFTSLQCGALQKMHGKTWHLSNIHRHYLVLINGKNCFHLAIFHLNYLIASG